MATKQQGFRGFRPKLVSFAVASCFVSSAALANPTGAQVVNGQVSVIQNGSLLQITNSPNSVINWQSFSIGANEITRFIQQSQASAVLNRVTAGNPSQILGTLQSNGRVFLINPSGIVFGAGSQIDVAGLVATSLNLSNQDFLAGKLKFTDVPGAGSVVNQGNITTGTGGQVYLVGPAVTNNGIIASPNGEVVLAAGSSVELVNPGTPNLRVEITAADNAAMNLGQIMVDSGRAGIYAGLITNSGTIRANSVVAEGGKILLKATKSVTLESSSILDASGNGGGTIEVLAKDGGTVNVAGRLDASAPVSGDGGFIETSADRVKIADGTVITTTAAHGKTGMWLVDPTDFRVDALAYGGDITGAQLGSILDTTNVTKTSDDGAGGAYGGIIINQPVAWSSANSLTLIARGDVDVDGAITNTAATGGGLNIYAGWDGISSATPTVDGAYGGHIYLPSPITMNATTGKVVLVAAGEISQDSSGAPLVAGSVAAVSTGDSVVIDSAPNAVGTLAGSAKNNFTFSNNQSLTIGSVDTGNPNFGMVNGITVTGPGSATVTINVASSTLGVPADLNVNKDILATATGSFSNSSIQLNVNGSSSYGGAVNVNGASVIATGGNAGFGDGGSASININGVTGASVTGGTLRAQGGAGVDGGEGGNGGYANVAVSSGNSTLNVTNSTIEALGGAGAPGSGSSGGSAQVYLSSGSPTTINLSGSTVRAIAGSGDVMSYGYVDINDNSSNINITNSTIRADGAEGSIYVSALGNVTISGSTLSANGAPGGFGGLALIEVNGSTVTVNNSALSATGGNLASSAGGEGLIEIYANGIGGANISGSTIAATGGTGTTQGFADIEIESGLSGGNVVIDGSTIQAAGVGADVSLESSAGVTATNSTISATGQTGPTGSSGITFLIADNGAVNTSGSTISAVGRTMADGGEGSGVLVGANGDITLGLLASNDFVSVQSSGGRILDGNSGANVSAPTTFLVATNGVGSLADPLETQTSDLTVATTGGEIGVINSGNLILSSLQNSGTGANAVGTTGTMVFSTPISVSGNLALLAGNGMVVEQTISAGGDLTLDSGIGDLGFTGVSVFGNNVNLSGNNILVGFTTSAEPTTVMASNLMTVKTAANLNVLGGANAGANAVLGGGVDVDLTVGTTGGFVNVAGGSAGASAQISAGSTDTIALLFPNLSSGGYFVNGVDGAISDGNTGFFANGMPAVLGDSFIVTYGTSALPTGVQQAIDQVVAVTNQQTNVITDANSNSSTDSEGGTGDGKDDKEKKQLPICGK